MSSEIVNIVRNVHRIDFQSLNDEMNPADDIVSRSSGHVLQIGLHALVNNRMVSARCSGVAERPIHPVYRYV